MPAKQKSVKTVLKKKNETRNRLILYISAVSIGLPLLVANIYLQNQNTNVLGASFGPSPSGTQSQNANGDFQNKLTCSMCVKVVHGDGVIVLQQQSQNSGEWGAICLPKAALTTTVSPSPRPSVTPSGFTRKPTPKVTPSQSNNSAASFKNMPYILCPQPTGSPSVTPSEGPRPGVTPKFSFGVQHTTLTGTPNR